MEGAAKNLIAQANGGTRNCGGNIVALSQKFLELAVARILALRVFEVSWAYLENQWTDLVETGVKMLSSLSGN